MLLKTRIALLMIAVSAPLAAAQAEPQNAAGTEAAAETPAQAEQRSEGPAAEERRICRRIETTGSRTGAQRVCMTAEQWRRAEY